METKQCSDCQQTKAVAEFYTHTGSGNPYGRCKACHTKKTAEYSSKDQEPPEHEKRIVQWLLSRGIPAIHGKYLDLPEYNFVDIVAFGCLRIECKIPQKDNRIHFTETQRDTNPHADIVIIERYEREYAVFPITYAGFYTGASLQLRVSMEPEHYQAYHNRVDLIQLALQRKCVTLAEQHTEKAPIQLTLFEKAG